MKEESKRPSRETFERRRKARDTKDLLSELTDTIDAASSEPEHSPDLKEIRVGASGKEKKTDPNRKTIRFHEDIRKAIQDYAREERRNFSDVLKEVLMAGMRVKGIELK